MDGIYMTAKNIHCMTDIELEIGILKIKKKKREIVNII